MTEHIDKFRTGVATDSYRENHSRIFGEKSAKGGSWVFDEAKGEFVDKASLPEKAKSNAPYFMPDIGGGVSPASGEWVEGRAAMREHCKRTDTYHIGGSDFSSMRKNYEKKLNMSVADSINIRDII